MPNTLSQADKAAHDWVATLKDPTSLPYKKLWNEEFFTELFNYVAFEKAVIRYLEVVQRIEKNERRVLDEEMTNATQRLHEFMKKCTDEQNALREKLSKLDNPAITDVQKSIDLISASIANCEQEIQRIEQRIPEIKEHLSKLDKSWNEKQETQAQEFAQRLRDLPVKDKTFLIKRIVEDEHGNKQTVEDSIALTDIKIARMQEQSKGSSMGDLIKVNNSILDRFIDASTEAVTAITDAATDVADSISTEASKVVDAIAGMADVSKFLNVMREALMDEDDFYHKPLAPGAEPQREAEPEDAFNPSKALMNRLRDNKPQCEIIAGAITKSDKSEIKEYCGFKALERREEARLAALKEQIRLEKLEQQALEKLKVTLTQDSNQTTNAPIRQADLRSDDPAPSSNRDNNPTRGR